MPALTPKGYFDGKRAAEQAAREMVGPSFGAAVLKPGGAQCTHMRPCALHSRIITRSHLRDTLRGAVAHPPVAVHGPRLGGDAPPA
jgi:hypothetical protein